MNDFLKYTNPSWNEVLTEQGGQLPCSGNSRKDKLVFYLQKKDKKDNYKFQTWENFESLYKREIAIDFGMNSKVYKELERKQIYGYPKRCPIINKITNLIIFI